MANVNSLPSGPVAFCARKCVKMEFRPVGNEMGNKRGQGGAYPLGPQGEARQSLKIFTFCS